jgi:DNA-directed RNA polymerase subunit RPC12/RpoP
MTIEPADGPCPKCGATRHKAHTLEYDVAICNECGHREAI